MQVADVGFIAAILREISKAECKLSELRKAANGDALLVSEERKLNKTTLASTIPGFQAIGFLGVCDSLEAAIANLDEDPSFIPTFS